MTASTPSNGTLIPYRGIPRSEATGAWRAPISGFLREIFRAAYQMLHGASAAMRGSEMHTHDHAIAEPRIDRRECGDEQTDEEQDRKDRIAFQHVSDAGD